MYTYAEYKTPVENFFKEMERKGPVQFVPLSETPNSDILSLSVNQGMLQQPLLGLFFEFARFPQDEYAGNLIEQRLKSYIEDWERISEGTERPIFHNFLEETRGIVASCRKNKEPLPMEIRYAIVGEPVVINTMSN